MLKLRRNKIFPYSASVYFYFSKNACSLFAYLQYDGNVVSQQSELCIFRCVASAAHFFVSRRKMKRMKQTFRKSVTIALTALMMFTAAPLAGFVGIDLPEMKLSDWNLSDFNFNLSADAVEIVKSGSCGTNVNYSLDSDGVLTISGTGEMNDDDYSSVPWYSNQDTIKTVIIEKGVASIGDYAFCGCRSLTSVTIPDSVMSIGSFSFLDCHSLTSVTIPNSVTNIGESAFDNCTSLTSVEFCDNSQLKSIGISAFINCRALKSINFGENNQLIDIGYRAFANCQSLVSITIPDNVRQIKYWTFMNCFSLASVTFGDSVTYIGGAAFNGCNSLVSIEIPDSVTHIDEEAFSNCHFLSSITIPDHVIIGSDLFSSTAYYKDENNWTDGVLYIGNHLIAAKRDISGSYVIKDGTKTISGYAFAGCESLTSVTIPNSVTSIGDSAFSECTSLTSITIPNSVTYIGEHAFDDTAYYNNENNWTDGVLYIGNHLIEAKNDISGFYAIKDGTKTIVGFAFAGCESLTSVTIPDSVTNIEENAFYSCESLTSVTIGNSVTSIGDSAFSSCNLLTVVNISDLANWCNIDFCTNFADDYCSNPLFSAHNLYLNGTLVTDLVIPDSVTAVNDFAFAGCTSLTSVTIPDSVTSIGYSAFENCTSLTSVSIPESVTKINSWAFENCSFLNSIHITDVAKWCNIDFGGFYANPLYYAHDLYLNETLVTDLTIPDSVTSVNDYTFHNCESLTAVTIPDSVTSIGEYAFCNCKSLISITLPDSVMSIEKYAFRNCFALHEITILNVICLIDDSCHTIPSAASIKGYVDSTAQDYAEKHIRTFESLGNAPYKILISGNCGENLTWSLDSFYILTISGTGKMTDYTASSAPWYSYRSVIKTIVIENGVASIGDSAFSECTSLTSITIPNSVTYIGVGAFDGIDTFEHVGYSGTESQLGNMEIHCSLPNILYPHLNFDVQTNITTTEIPGTCQQKGTKTVTCSCGYVYFAESTGFGPHAYTSAITTPATHTMEGVLTYTCECGDNYTEAIAKLEGHTYTSKVTTPATHTMEGVLTYTCECGDSYTEAIAKLEGHAYTSVVTKEATCTEDGSVTRTCACGATEIKIIPALGHNDADANNVCDNCSEVLDEPEMSFFEKILAFFRRIIDWFRNLFS